jgi:hypothetical protein
MFWSMRHNQNTVTLDESYTIPIFEFMMNSIEENDRVIAEVTAVHSQFPAGRLPCRGCTTRCKLYQSCNGKLWRMDRSDASAGPAGFRWTFRVLPRLLAVWCFSCDSAWQVSYGLLIRVIMHAQYPAGNTPGAFSSSCVCQLHSCPVSSEKIYPDQGNQ